jgi:hypothetical protein
MGKHIHSIDSKILDRIYGHGKGWTFTPANFLDLGSRNAVASALKRHKASGLIRQLARGLYDYPRNDSQLGVLSPSSDDVAKALSGRDATRLQPSGAHAANLLGLSDQVPMKILYLTDGASRTVMVGNRQIILKRTTPRNMATSGKISGLVIQALRYLGQTHVDDTLITKLDRRLDADARKQLLKDLHYAPSWIADIMRSIAEFQDGFNQKSAER